MNWWKLQVETRISCFAILEHIDKTKTQLKQEGLKSTTFAFDELNNEIIAFHLITNNSNKTIC